jgi:hypothetical protein
MDVFEVADYEEKTAAEKERQKARAGEAGYKSTDDIKQDIFQKAEAELVKGEPTPERPGTKDLPSNLDAMRMRLGMETGRQVGLL